MVLSSFEQVMSNGLWIAQSIDEIFPEWNPLQIKSKTIGFVRSSFSPIDFIATWPILLFSIENIM